MNSKEMRYLGHVACMEKIKTVKNFKNLKKKGRLRGVVVDFVSVRNYHAIDAYRGRGGKSQHITSLLLYSLCRRWRRLVNDILLSYASINRCKEDCFGPRDALNMVIEGGVPRIYHSGCYKAALLVSGNEPWPSSF